MASPAAAPSPHGGPGAPAADPEAIRACLPSSLLAEFDREWEIVLDRAKLCKSIAGVHDMLHKWRHVAFGEMRNPGTYDRLLATVERVTRTGRAPAGAVSGDEIRALITDRLLSRPE